MTFVWFHRYAFLLAVGCSTAPATNPEAGEPEAGDDASIRDAKPNPDSGSGGMILVDGPALLSQTGLYSDFANRVVAPGIVEFAPRWPLWSDSAEKRRWIELPSGKQIDTSTMDQWVFPVGTKLWKEFKVSNTVVETRFLWKVKDGGWQYWWMGAYRWRVDGSDADYVKMGEKNALGSMHDVPSQTDCIRCHDGVADVGIGFSAIQLSAAQNSQLAKFAAMSWFSTPPAQEWDAPGQGTEHDALGYMHANCGHCHNETAALYTVQTMLALRLRVNDSTPQQTGAYAAIGMKAKHVGTGMWGDYVFVAGRPDQSQAWLRMNVRDTGFWQMPPVCTNVIDTNGVALVGSWISVLQNPDM